MIIHVDIDGVICTVIDMGYESAIPIQENIDKINKLYDEGHTICYSTARGTVTGIDWYDMTQAQLKGWGCKHHELIVGRPHYDLIVDDKAKRIEEL